jgi:hypothetical protein
MEGSGHGIILGTIPEFVWRDRVKPIKAQNRLLLAEI